MNEKANKIIERIEKLQKESADTLSRLKSSLAIRELWPGVSFPCTSYAIGSYSEGFYFHVTSATGETKKFNLEELPEILMESESVQKAMFLKTRKRRKGGKID